MAKETMYGLLLWAICAILTTPVYGTRSCPDERWKYFHDSCYYFSPVPLSWNEAQQWCYTYRSAFLAEISSSEENEFIRQRLNTDNNGNIARGTRTKRKYHLEHLHFMIYNIGATDFVREGTFLWAYFFESILPGYTNWKEGSPDMTSSGNDKDCVEMMTSDGTWTDVPCEQRARFVCELPFFS